MASVKTPEERGLTAAWAYEVRDQIGLSPEQVVEGIGQYDPSTLRKAEADSKDMSRPLWRVLVAYYQQEANRRGIALRVPPPFGVEPVPAGDQAALVAALQAQTTAITSLVGRMEAALAGIERGLDAVAKAQRDAESGASSGRRSRGGIPR